MHMQRFMAIAFACIIGIYCPTATAMTAADNASSTSNGPSNPFAGAISSTNGAPTITVAASTTTANGKEAKASTPAITKTPQRTPKPAAFKGKLISSFTVSANDDPIVQIAYISRTECLATRTFNGQIQTWSWETLLSAENKKCLHTFDCHNYDEPFAITNNTLITVPDYKDAVTFFYPMTGIIKPLSIKTPVEPIKSFLTLPGYLIISLQDFNGTILVYARKTNKLEHHIGIGRSAEVIALDSTHIAASVSEGIYIVNIETGKIANKIMGPSTIHTTTSIASLPDSRIAISTYNGVTHNNTISIWDWKTNKELNKLTIETFTIPYMIARGDDQLIFIIDTGLVTTLCIWDLSTNTTKIIETSASGRHISSIAVIPSGELVVGCENGTVRIYA